MEAPIAAGTTQRKRLVGRAAIVSWMGGRGGEAMGGKMYDDDWGWSVRGTSVGGGSDWMVTLQHHNGVRDVLSKHGPLQLILTDRRYVRLKIFTLLRGSVLILHNAAWRHTIDQDNVAKRSHAGRIRKTTPSITTFCPPKKRKSYCSMNPLCSL